MEKRQKPNVSVTILCASELHGYCGISHLDYCACLCHSNVSTTKVDVGTFSYILWDVQNSLAARKETAEVQDSQLMEIINATEPYFDFEIADNARFLDALRPSFERDYWSRAESLIDIGVADVVFER